MNMKNFNLLSQPAQNSLTQNKVLYIYIYYSCLIFLSVEVMPFLFCSFFISNLTPRNVVPVVTQIDRIGILWMFFRPMNQFWEGQGCKGQRVINYALRKMYMSKNLTNCGPGKLWQWIDRLGPLLIV